MESGKIFAIIPVVLLIVFHTGCIEKFDFEDSNQDNIQNNPIISGGNYHSGLTRV